MCDERTGMKIARAVLNKFYRLKGIEGSVDLAVISTFAQELLEEIPPGELIFPYSELNEWFSRLKLNSIHVSACV
jgi:hypothetical protein